MVPNHMGIDSKMGDGGTRIGLSSSPTPVPFLRISFDGPTSRGSRPSAIFLEDHYYITVTAAVVFKVSDRETGSARYIYHGQ